MSSRAILGFVVALAIITSGGETYASACGPNNRVVRTTIESNGKSMSWCQCYPGYVPLVTPGTVVRGNPPRLPGCVRAKSTTAKTNRPQKQALGSYQAEPARESPLKREIPPKREPPAVKPKTPPDSQKSPTTLGATTPTQNQQQFAKKDSAASPFEVPPPRLGADAWSKTFPGEKSSAAFGLDRQGFDRLRGTNSASATWIGDEKSKKISFEKVIERLPFSEVLKSKWVSSGELIRRYKIMSESLIKDRTNAITGFFKVIHDSNACHGSTRTDCSSEEEKNLEIKKTKLADAEQGRGKSWWSRKK